MPSTPRCALVCAVSIFAVATPSWAVTTTLDPNNSLYSATGSFYSGVVGLVTTNAAGGFAFCSGSLLTGGTAVLTAAHCVTDTSGNIAPGTSVTVQFSGGLGSYITNDVLVNPTFNPVSLVGDLAIVRMSAPVAGATTYDIYRGQDEAGQIGDIVGLGRSGTGLQGAVIASGTKRHGTNMVDFVYSPTAGGPYVFLGMDFDDGTVQRNASGYLNSAFGNLGTGNTEIGVAKGDSGGPLFLGGRIAGVSSYGSCLVNPANRDICASPPDVNTIVDSTYGELFFSTRVSSFSGFVESVVPEPGTWTLFGAGLIVVVFRFQRRNSFGARSESCRSTRNVQDTGTVSGG